MPQARSARWWPASRCVSGKYKVAQVKSDCCELLRLLLCCACLRVSPLTSLPARSRGNFVEAEASAVEPFPTLSKAKVVGAKHSWGGVAGVAAGAAGAARASPGLTWIAGTATSTSTTPSQATPGTPSKNYQGQPWKWRIKGPLTISAQKKGKGFRR